MSVNLILWDKDNQFSLYQTPTALTQRVLAADDSQRALLYKAWVIDMCGDPVHPLPDCECSAHLARLNQWLEQAKQPKWGMT